MEQAPAAPDARRYIVRSDDSKQVAAFIDSIRNTPDIKLVDQIGPPGAPHTVVILARSEQAEAMRQCLGASSKLIIEPDQPLSLFGEA